MFVKKNISAKYHRFFSQTINIVRMTPLHCPWFEGPLVNNKWPFVGKQPQERPEDGPGRKFPILQGPTSVNKIQLLFTANWNLKDFIRVRDLLKR